MGRITAYPKHSEGHRRGPSYLAQWGYRQNYDVSQMELRRLHALGALRTVAASTIHVSQRNLCEVSAGPWNQGIQRDRSKKAIPKFQIGRNTHGVDAWRLAFLASRAASRWNLTESG